MQVPNDLGHTVLLSKAHHQGDGSEVEQLRLKSVPIWDAGVAGLTCCVTKLSLWFDWLLLLLRVRLFCPLF